MNLLILHPEHWTNWIWYMKQCNKWIWLCLHCNKRIL